MSKYTLEEERDYHRICMGILHDVKRLESEGKLK